MNCHIYYNCSPLKIQAILTNNVDLILKVQRSVCGLQRYFSNIQHLDCFMLLIFQYSCAHLPTKLTCEYFFISSGAKTENCNIYEKRTYTSFRGGFQMNKNEGRKCVYWYILFVYHKYAQLAALSLWGPSVIIPVSYHKCNINLILTLTLKTSLNPERDLWSCKEQPICSHIQKCSHFWS